MKIQRPSYEIWLQKPGELGIYQQIEPCIWYANMESCRFIPTTSSHV